MILDGSGTHYAEVELSPANVTCDVRMIQGSPDKKMDLAWELVGLSTRVFRREDGWSGLLFLPWEGLRSLPSAWNAFAVESLRERRPGDLDPGIGEDRRDLTGHRFIAARDEFVFQEFALVTPQQLQRGRGAGHSGRQAWRSWLALHTAETGFLATLGYHPPSAVNILQLFDFSFNKMH